MHIGIPFILLILGVALAVKSCVSEIERDVDCDHGKIENVEEESEEEDEAHRSARNLRHCGLEYLADDSASIAYKNEHLEEKALALSGTGNVGLSY